MDLFIPITAVIAILLFLLREILEMFKSRKKQKKSRHALSLILAHELELNLWSLISLFNLLRSLAAYKSLDEIKLTIQKGIETNYNIKIEESNGMWQGQAIPPFYTSRYEKMLLPIAELDKDSYSKIVNAYETLNELENVRTHVLNLFAGNEWVDFPEMTFDYLQNTSMLYDEYYQPLNLAYISLTGNVLKKHRL